MRILALGSLNSGVSFHRIIMPLIYMVQGTNDFVKITNQIDNEQLEQGWDIVVMNRSVSFPAHKMAEFKQRYGFTLVVDNDDYWELDPHHNLADHYLTNNIAQQIIDYIQIADICTVTHERLAAEVYKYNKNVHVIPNALPFGDGQFSAAKQPSDKVRLFWSGSDTHAQDVSILRNPMQRVYGDYDLRSKIKTNMAGYTEKAKPIWDIMISAFTTGLRFDSTIYQIALPEKYMNAYCDSDISVIPLLNTKFNGYKSNLKVLEAATKRNPAIVSMVDPYLDMPLCYVRSQQYWYKWIKELVNDKAMREEKGNELFNYCNKHFNLLTVNKKRHELYSSNCHNLS
jgi:hypothetical protein